MTDARLAGKLHAFAVAQGEQSGGRGATLSRESEDALLRYLELLSKWNRVYNLTAITQPVQMLTHHLLDSLAIAAPLDRLLATKPAREVLDVGSGAGLPGIPLAIARREWSLTLIDSSGKKTAFVQQAVAELALANVRVITSRVENCTGMQYDVIVARAFSSLRDLVLRTRPLLRSGGTWAAMKGAVPHDEITELPDDVHCRTIVPLHVPGLDAERHLLLLEVKEA